MDPIRSLADLRPGDIALGPIHGAAGVLVNIGQLMLGEGFRVGELDIRHARIVTSAQEHDNTDPDYPTGVLYGPYAVEAMPSGARHVGLHGGNAWDPEWAYFRMAEDYEGQAADAAAIAEAMVGTPYSFASYAALAAWRFGVKAPRLERWINRRDLPPKIIDWPSGTGPLRTTSRPSLNEVALPAEAICSVLVDQAWSLAGKRVMEGVPHQAVTPGALAGRLLQMVSTGEATMTVPSWL